MSTKYIDALELIKQNISSLATKTIMDKLVSKAAFMAWGPINSLASMLITKLLKFALEKTVLELYILKVHYQIDKQVKEVNDILKDIHSEMDEAKRIEVDDKLKNAYRKLIKF